MTRGAMTVEELATFTGMPGKEEYSPQEAAESILALLDMRAWKPGDPEVSPLNAWVDYCLGAAARRPL